VGDSVLIILRDTGERLSVYVDDQSVHMERRVLLFRGGGG